VGNRCLITSNDYKIGSFEIDPGKRLIDGNDICGLCAEISYHNKQDNTRLEREKKYWDSVYPEFKQQVRVDVWSGSWALMLPHFATIQEDHRLRYKDDIENVLREKFVAKSLVHTDVHWRNIGCYENTNGERTVVLYDLDGVEEFNVEKHEGWVEVALKTLFPVVDEDVL
jgi:hypothetical protein